MQTATPPIRKREPIAPTDASESWQSRYWHFRAESRQDLLDFTDKLVADCVAAGQFSDEAAARWKARRAALEAEIEAAYTNADHFARIAAERAGRS